MMESSPRSLPAPSRVSTTSFLFLLALLLLPAGLDAATAQIATTDALSPFSETQPPRSLDAVFTSSFFLLAGIFVVLLLGLTLLEDWMIHIPGLVRIDRWFASKEKHSLTVMRLAAAITFVWCWQEGTLMSADRFVDAAWIAWAQLIIAALFVFRPLLPLAGIGILMLFGIGIARFGIFSMLDHLLLAGMAWYFIAHDSKKPSLAASALPALYASVGFCLIWLGAAKLFDPAWTSLLRTQLPSLPGGLTHEQLVQIAAFVDISVGFIVLVCLQERLLALVVTLIFVLSTMWFGPAQVLGNTLTFAALITFLIAGPGPATPPLHWIENLKLRVPATGIAFLGLAATILVPYAFGARVRHEIAAAQAPRSLPAGATQEVETTGPLQIPALALTLHKDAVAGWNLELVTENFQFAPASLGSAHVPGQGYARLDIDGQPAGRLYGPWFHLPGLPPGPHEIQVTLYANNHAPLAHQGRIIRSSTSFEVVP